MTPKGEQLLDWGEAYTLISCSRGGAGDGGLLNKVLDGKVQRKFSQLLFVSTIAFDFRNQLTQSRGLSSLKSLFDSIRSRGFDWQRQEWSLPVIAYLRLLLGIEPLAISGSIMYQSRVGAACAPIRYSAREKNKGFYCLGANKEDLMRCYNK